MIYMRLEPKLEQALNNMAKSLGLSRSELIRRSISDYLDKLNKPTAWEAGRDLFGRHASGQGNLAAARKKLAKEKIRAKRDNLAKSP